MSSGVTFQAIQLSWSYYCSVKSVFLCWSLQLKDLVVQLLDKQRLPHGEVQTHGTPRRLVVGFVSLWLVPFTYSVSLVCFEKLYEMSTRKEVVGKGVHYI